MRTGRSQTGIGIALTAGLAVGMLALAPAVEAGTSVRVKANVAKKVAGPYGPELEVNLGPLDHRDLFLKVKSIDDEKAPIEVEQFSTVPPGWSFLWFKKGTGEEVTTAVLDDGYVFNLGAGKTKTFRVKIVRRAFSIETSCLNVSAGDEVGGVDASRIGINRSVITCI